MLRSLKEILGYRLMAKDGWSGKVKDFLFDDLFWSVRYLVADSGRILPGKRVLISPMLLEEPSWTRQELPVELTRDQVKHCHGIDDDEPVSRQMLNKAGHLAWPNIWAASESLALGQVPIPPAALAALEDQSDEPEGDPHLRSVREVLGYHILAEDDSVGHVEDFIVEAHSWILRYLVLDTRKVLPGGKKVLIAPGWIEDVSWNEEQVTIQVKKETIDRAPEFDPGAPVNRAYEVALFDYYGRPVYWQEQRSGPKASG